MVCYLRKGGQEVLSMEETTEQRPESDERVSHSIILGRASSTKGSEVRVTSVRSGGGD